jgi:CRISPR-associated exonuclease Cas4
MLNVAVPRGAVYYGATRKRHEVVFDEPIRARTLELIEAVRSMLIAQQLPPAPNDARCRNCSLVHACLPAVVGQRERLRYLQRMLYQPLDADSQKE